MSVDIPTPPTPPSAASPGTFQARADAFLAWWAALAADMDGQGPMLGVSDILGTVSQSGGTPTGALMETGAVGGAGRYWRFANGLQICTVSATAAYSTANSLRYDWTFPASFAESPSVHVASETMSGSFTPAISGLGVTTASNITTTSASVRQYRVTGTTDFQPADTIPINATAVGRWF